MKKISERILHAGEWLLLKELIFHTDDGKRVLWESVQRTRSRAVVVVIAKLVPSNRVVLIKQYRPAVGRHVLGFPAGMTDSEDAIATEGLRELKEETGYTGEVVHVSPPIHASVGLIDENTYVVTARVDERAPENLAPRQDLEPEEEIEVVLKPEDELRSWLEEEGRRGTGLSAGLWYAFGLAPLSGVR